MTSKQPTTPTTITLRPAHILDHPILARLTSEAFFNDILFGHIIHPYRHRYPTDSDHYWLSRSLPYHFDRSHRIIVATTTTTIDNLTRAHEHIIGQAHWSLIHPNPPVPQWSLHRYDPRRLLPSLVSTILRLLNAVGLYTNRAISPIHASIIEQSYPFLDHLWTNRNRSPCLNLESLAVHPNFQGKGVGKLLVRQGLAMAEKEGWCASVISAEGKEGFYQSCGFDVGPVGRSGEGGKGNMLWDVPGGLVFFRDAPGLRRTQAEVDEEVVETMRWLKEDVEAGWPCRYVEERQAPSSSPAAPSMAKT